MASARSKSTTTRHESLSDIAAASTAGLVETLFFHPMDTTKKRIQKHEGTIRQAGVPYRASLSKVVFGSAAQANIFAKLLSMYQGLSFALFYKIVQRGYKLGLQPTVKRKMKESWGEPFKRVFGVNADIALNALAGGLLGSGEVSFIFLDALKIKAQLNAEAYKGLSAYQILRMENLWYAWQVTALRNFLGSGLYFGAPALVKQHVFGLEADQKMTFFQNGATSTTGALLSIGVPNGFDVVKTRMQAKKHAAEETKISAVKTAENILRQEGVRAFSKGLGTALVTNGPKSAFAMFATNWLRDKFSAPEEKYSAPKKR